MAGAPLDDVRARDRARQPTPIQSQKRGPRTVLSDDELVVEIRDVLKNSEFLVEGHRKVRARLRARGNRAGKIALDLGLRHDWGPQYTAHQFQAELSWLGIRSTASYMGEPECNGVAERFIRTLKEECLYLHDLQRLEQAREVIGEFIERYNHGWSCSGAAIRPRSKPVRRSPERRRDQAAHLSRQPGPVHSDKILV